MPLPLAAAGLGGLFSGLFSNPGMMLGLGMLAGTLFGGSGQSKPAAQQSNYRPVAYSRGDPRFPGDDYQPGKDDEWRYYAGGGPVRKYEHGGGVHGHGVQNSHRWNYAAGGPVRHYAEGGPVAPPVAPKGKPQDQQLIAAAIAALSGQAPNPQAILTAFVKRFGKMALADLMKRVQSDMSGEEQQAPTSGGPVTGPGDGRSDSVPATIDGEQPAALSSGEFVVPSDVVSGLGSGDTNAGTRQLMEMMQKVRANHPRP